MADSTAVDYTKMKVIELRRELKNRGLSTTGDKAELISRLQSADLNLDSDEIDSDGVLEDDLKSNQDLLDESDVLGEELIETAPSPDKQPTKPKLLKRKSSEIATEVKEKPVESEEPTAKKISLNRQSNPVETNPEVKTSEDQNNTPKPTEKVKTNVEMDAKARLEMRAKRFGLPASETERKEARKMRFGMTLGSSNTATTSEEAEKLKKRAERFGECVSSKLTALSNEEKLQKRAQKFGLVK